MARTLFFLVFFALVLSLIFGMHYYLWLRLVHDLALGATTKGVLTTVLWLLGATIPLAMLTSRSVRPELARFWVKPGYVWFGASFLFAVSVALVDVVRQIHQALAALGGAPLNADQRETQAVVVAATAVALGLTATVKALLEARQLHVKRVEVALENLPSSLEGTTIVQLSDMHVGATIGRAFVQRVTRRVNELHADVVAITGDLVDGSVAALAHHVAPLQDVKSRFGTYFVTGNHEYYSGAPAWCHHLSELGIVVLRNEHVKIGPVGQHLHLAGVDDLDATRVGEPGHGPNVSRAVQGRDPQLPLVLLAHQPKVVTQAVECGVDLQLSGHTHGGQLWPFNWLMSFQQPAVAGLKRIEQTLVYVSRGTGSGGLPMRLFAPPEITQIVLRRA